MKFPRATTASHRRGPNKHRPTTPKRPVGASARTKKKRPDRAADQITKPPTAWPPPTPVAAQQRWSRGLSTHASVAAVASSAARPPSNAVPLTGRGLPSALDAAGGARRNRRLHRRDVGRKRRRRARRAPGAPVARGRARDRQRRDVPPFGADRFGFARASVDERAGTQRHRTLRNRETGDEARARARRPRRYAGT